MSNDVLALGDIVRLKQPYRPPDWVMQKTAEWKGFEFGIVAEFEANGRVNLFLYDSDGQLLIMPSLVPQALLIPTYVEFDLVELVRYTIVSESGYSQSPE